MRINMNRLLYLALIAIALLWASPTAFACPLCKEAIANSEPVEEPSGADLPAAYNNSIYLMVGMPYLLLGVFGFLVYRGLQQNARFVQARAAFPTGSDLPTITSALNQEHSRD